MAYDIRRAQRNCHAPILNINTFHVIKLNFYRVNKRNSKCRPDSVATAALFSWYLKNYPHGITADKSYHSYCGVIAKCWSHCRPSHARHYERCFTPIEEENSDKVIIKLY